MGDILNALSIILIFSGLIFFMGASVGLLRFPDFYTRMHAAGKGDTLSTILITAGMSAQGGGEGGEGAGRAGRRDGVRPDMKREEL